MKKSISISIILLTISLNALSQNQPLTRYLNVVNDKNIRPNADPKLCASCSENNFVVDGNETSGYIELEFEGINTFGQVKEVELYLNCANVEWAESNDGLSVYLGNDKVGSIPAIARNSSFIVKLDASKIGLNKNIKLTLKGNGKDGLYILSKKSGFGAVLKLMY
jgi:hypothetical protein